MLYELDPTRLSNTKNSKSVKHVFQTENDNQCLCHISLNFANEEVTELPKPLPATIPESPLYPLVKPYLLFMQVWGLFFSMGPNDQRVNFWRLYCGFGVLIQLSTTVFYVLPFYLTMEFESFTVNMLITCLWTVQNGITAYTVYSMCSDESKLKLFFTLWTTLVSCKVESDEISKYIISRRNIILSSCVIFNIIFSTGELLN